METAISVRCCSTLIISHGYFVKGIEQLIFTVEIACFGQNNSLTMPIFCHASVTAIEYALLLIWLVVMMSQPFFLSHQIVWFQYFRAANHYNFCGIITISVLHYDHTLKITINLPFPVISRMQCSCPRPHGMKAFAGPANWNGAFFQEGIEFCGGDVYYLYSMQEIPSFIQCFLICR